MASADDKADFAKRKSYPPPKTMVPEFPKFADHAPTMRRGDQERWKKFDDMMEKWRKALINTTTDQQ